VTHPSRPDLALYSGCDLNFWKRFRVEHHLHDCEECRREVEAFRGRRQSIRTVAEEMPPGAEWNVLAAEMRANIRLGLSAAECIANVGIPSRVRSFRWQLAAGTAAVAVFVTGGLWVYSRATQAAPQATVAASAPVTGQMILKATRAGLEMERDGRGMTLTYTSGARVIPAVAVSHGGLNARYVDDETGQVTIHHVFAE